MRCAVAAHLHLHLFVCVSELLPWLSMHAAWRCVVRSAHDTWPPVRIASLFAVTHVQMIAGPFMSNTSNVTGDMLTC